MSYTFPCTPKPLRTAGTLRFSEHSLHQALPHTHYSLTLTPTQGGGHPCSDFTAEETEVHRGYATCLRSHSGPEGLLGLEPGFNSSQRPTQPDGRLGEMQRESPPRPEPTSLGDCRTQPSVLSLGEIRPA